MGAYILDALGVDSPAALVLHCGMAWAKPEFSSTRVDRAGHALAVERLPTAREPDLSVINNWRSAHGFPLQIIKMRLIKRSKKVSELAIVAQRIKTIRAIHRKLGLNAAMKLSKMHDVGGCRAVLTTVEQVEKLTALYEKAVAKNPRRGAEFVKKYDYITHPKDTGYRGIHLVYKYCSDSPRFSCYNGLRIEIQLRSRIQHAWATAVEAVDYFTSQALKSNIGQEDWKRFFVLVSSAFAALEERPGIPGVLLPDALEELCKLQSKVALLEGFQKATEQIQNKESHVFLLELDSEKRTIKTKGYEKRFTLQAQIDYLSLEKVIKDKPHIQAVLVSVDSFRALKKAYPNFFLDVSVFLSLVRAIIKLKEKQDAKAKEAQNRKA